MTLKPILSLLALATFGFVAPAQAGSVLTSRTLQNACFAPAALAAVPGEEIARKGDRSFSMPLSHKTPLLAASPVPDGLRGAIRRVDLPPGQKLVALTFDLCEDNAEVAGYEGRIFETLRRENVKATLFAGGKWMRSHEARTQQLMTDPLFEIGNHAEAHRNLRLLKPDVMQDEILGPQRAYELIRKRLSENQCAASASGDLQSIPPRIGLFRFPYGACNPESMKAVNDAGLLAIQWDLSTGDPSPGTSAEAIVRSVSSTKPGSIIIAHANGRGWHTADALPRLIASLKKRGFTFVTVSELLAAGRPVIADTCYDSRPGDTDRYDHFPGLLASRKQVPTSALDLLWGKTQVSPEPKAVVKPRVRPMEGDDHGAKPAQ